MCVTESNLLEKDPGLKSLDDSKPEVMRSLKTGLHQRLAVFLRRECK